LLYFVVFVRFFVAPLQQTLDLALALQFGSVKGSCADSG
jgi:hypothetical protein